MAYIPQTWADGSTGGTPISASRLAHIESGLQAAAAVADAAVTPAAASAAYQVKSTPLVVTPEQYGALGDGATDDTAAIQAAIDAVAANGGGTVLFGVGANYSKSYFVSSAPRTDRRGNSIIALPASGSGTILLRGFGAAAGGPWSYIRCARTTDTYSGTFGPPSVVGGPTPENAGGTGLAAFSNWNVIIDGVGISLPANPKIAGYDLGEMITASVDNLTVYTDTTAGVYTQPTAVYAFGVRMPRSLNSGSLPVDHYAAFGMYVGLVLSSPHTDIRSITTKHCLLGIGASDDVSSTVGDAHASRIAYWQSEHCKYHLGGWSVGSGAQENAGTTTTRLDIGVWDIEDAPVDGSWWNTSFHILDQNNTFSGGACVNYVLGGTGPTANSLTIFGAGKFALRYITDPIETRWATYTPTLSGTGWAIGNGSVTGRSQRVGKTVHFVATFVAGTTSTFGSGGLGISLPVARNGNGNVDHPCHARFVHAGNLYYGHGDLGTSTTAAAVYALSATTGQHLAVTASTPFAWASGDTITVFGFYESA